MNLYCWEVAKILKRRSSRIALILALCWTVVGMLVNIFYGNSYKVDDQTPRIPGPQEIHNQLEWAEAWRGPLTEEKMMSAQQIIYDTARDPEKLDDQGEIREDVWNREIRPLVGMWNVISSIGNSVYKISYQEWQDTEPSVLQTAYADRKTAVTEWLQSQLPDETDRALFEAQEAQVQTPFYYDWYSGQYSTIILLSTLLVGICLFVCIAVAPLFSGEVQTGTIAVSHASRHGRGRLTGAKIAAAFTVAAVTWLLCTVLIVVLQIAFFGTRGLECPIQLAKPLATAPLTFADCEIYTLALGLLYCLSATGITIALSAKFSSTFPVIVWVFGLLVLLPLFGGMLPWVVQQGIALLPGAGDVYDLFRLNLYHLFGKPIWSPILQMAIQPVYLVIALPAAALLYLRREVR